MSWVELFSDGPGEWIISDAEPEPVFIADADVRADERERLTDDGS